MANIVHGRQDRLYLGNLSAQRDWGYAPDFVQCMWLILQHRQPDDFVIATGKMHSVREFCTHAFRRAGIELEWRGAGVEEQGVDRRTGRALVAVDPRYFRPTEVEQLLGDPRKAVRELGADHAILYKDNDWAAEVKKLVGQVDVVLDMVAGDYLPKNLALLRQDGRCVVIALLGGAKAEVSAAAVMVNRLTLTGSTLRPQSIASKARMAQGLREKVWPLLEKGTIKPIIFKTFPLKDAAGAHAELERADHVGKVMLSV